MTSVIRHPEAPARKGNINLVAGHARRYPRRRSRSGSPLPPGPGMKCPKCQHDNADNAKFCEQCAAPLGQTCANCGSPAPSTAKFCPQCGHPLKRIADDPSTALLKSHTFPSIWSIKFLTSKAALEGERKQVTVLFADIKSSMELLADRDPEDAKKLLDPVVDSHD